jgi:hypothetical protein
MLQNPIIPDFNDYLRIDQASRLRLDLNKLKLDVILDSFVWNTYEKHLQIEWKYALVVSYDWKGWYVLSFDEHDDWLMIKQLQWWSSKVSYKINTSLKLIPFYIDFFKKNIIGKIKKINITTVPTWLENPSTVLCWDPYTRYIIFKTKLDNLLLNN